MAADTSEVLSPDLIRSRMAETPGADEISLYAHLDRLPTIKLATDTLIAEAMKRSRYNQTAASKILGIKQSTLSGRLKRQKKRT